MAKTTPRQAVRGKTAPKSRPGKAAPAAGRQAARRATPAAKPSKEELRVQAEKLERANALLRGKNKELKRSLNEANVRIAELEDGAARHERDAVKADAPEPEAAPAKPARQRKSRPAPKPQRRKRVSAGVSDTTAEAPDDEADRKAPGHPDEELSFEPDAEASA